MKYTHTECNYPIRNKWSALEKRPNEHEAKLRSLNAFTIIITYSNL